MPQTTDNIKRYFVVINFKFYYDIKIIILKTQTLIYQTPHKEKCTYFEKFILQNNSTFS